jgi:hypothetical protein
LVTWTILGIINWCFGCKNNVVKSGTNPSRDGKKHQLTTPRMVRVTNPAFL